jgi:TldD protein
VQDTELLGVGIRALVNGCWGFASSPYWLGDEPVLLGRAAAQHARAAAAVTPSDLTLSPRPVVSGTWVMPVGVDPFTLPVEEKRDFFESWIAAVAGYSGMIGVQIQGSSVWSMTFTRQEHALATSDGSYVSQVGYQSALDGPLTFVFDPRDPRKWIGRAIRQVDLAGAGWDYLLEAQIPDQLPGLYDEARELLFTQHKPAEPGRMDVVFDAATTARLVGQTIGCATELDRALGDEANATGTSFLGPDVLAMLGQPLGAPLITVTGDRHLPRGLATVKWDAEGVEPDVVTLVQNGLLRDYQTTRSGVGVLEAWYGRVQMPQRSHGCAAASSALDLTLQAPPNVSLTPGATAVGMTDLITSTPKGFAVYDADVTTDFQAKRGLIKGGVVREIVNGRLGAIVDNAGLLFDTPELWKNVTTLGGATSAVQIPLWREKGEPVQRLPYTARAVPILAKNVAVTDVKRR